MFFNKKHCVFKIPGLTNLLSGLSIPPISQQEKTPFGTFRRWLSNKIMHTFRKTNMEEMKRSIKVKNKQQKTQRKQRILIRFKVMLELCLILLPLEHVVQTIPMSCQSRQFKRSPLIYVFEVFGIGHYHDRAFGFVTQFIRCEHNASLIFLSLLAMCCKMFFKLILKRKGYLH